MKKTARGLLKTLATRSVIAAIPVAMVSGYASNMAAPMPPRIAAYEFQQVAEITVSPTTVGVAASPLYGQTKAQIDQQLDEMQALGVQNIRVFVPWGLVDFFGPSEAGSTSWDLLDTVMQSAKEHDMGVLAEINSTPPYAVTNGGVGSGTPDTTDFAAFVTKFVTKYGSEVSAYEIWNEPNSVQFSSPIDPAAYAALVKAAYQAIKPLDPTATIVAGAVGHTVTWGNLTMDPVDFVKAMIAADPTIGQYFDALSYHPYDENTPFSQGNLDPNSAWYASDTAFNQLKDLIALFPTKKVWLSEFGVPTYTYTDTNGVVHTITQDQQEKLIADLINTWGAAFGQNAGPIFLYTGRDTATGSTNPEDNFGLWDMLGQPKEVITQFLAQWYKDHPQNTTGPTTPTGPGTGTPTDPAAALAAAFQALAQQIAQGLANAQAFAQQIAVAIATSIANALASFGQPQAVATAAPQTLRVASVEAPATTSSESTTTTADTTASAEQPATGSPAVTEAAVSEPAVSEPTVAEPTVAEAAVTEPVVKEPAVTEPATSTPAATTPTVTAPDATPPAATPPAATPPATAPASTKPEPTKPEPTKPGAGNGDGDGDGAQAGAVKPPKTPKTPKTPDKVKPLQDKPAPVVRPGPGEGRDASSSPDQTPRADAATTSEGHATAG